MCIEIMIWCEQKTAVNRYSVYYLILHHIVSAALRAALTNRSSGSPLRSVTPSAGLHFADSAQLGR
jgi:hypothetical protein